MEMKITLWANLDWCSSWNKEEKKKKVQVILINAHLDIFIDSH